ncbi:unnamed protein product [Alopecurus aequalis]
MLISNERTDDLTRSSKKNERTDDLTRNSKNIRITYSTRSLAKKNRICNDGEPTELLISGDLHRNSDQGVLSSLREEVASNLSKSVVSIALFDGETMLFACSGIPVQRLGNVTRFVTSAKLAKVFGDKKKDHDDLKVQVRHGDKVVTGFLDKCDQYLNVAAVNVMDLSDLRTVVFSHGVKFRPHIKVVAVGSDVNGNLIFTGGILNGYSCGSCYMSSTCKISEVCEGGPLYDFDGNFVGINLLGTETTPFLPRITVLPWFLRCRPLEDIKFSAPSNSSKETVRNCLNKYQSGDLESLGYPKPSNDGMILVNTFEEPFGDVCGEGVWRELTETTCDILKGNIVALASFCGDKRYFACTGLFIEWNGCTTILTSGSLLREPGYTDQKIVKNLRIEVLLPNKDRVEGKLQHVSLHYNVALVSVKDYCVTQPPVKVEQRWPDSGKVLALGRCFSSGRLIATRGQKYPRRSVKFDCKYLGYSSCKITKAGIGGPLVDLDGKFFGMNFYDKYVGHTPYLSWWEILPLLEYFKTKGTVAEGDDCGNSSNKPDWTKDGDDSVCCNSWPVPSPCWDDPDVVEKVEREALSRVPRHLWEASTSESGFGSGSESE